MSIAKDIKICYQQDYINTFMKLTYFRSWPLSCGIKQKEKWNARIMVSCQNQRENSKQVGYYKPNPKRFTQRTEILWKKWRTWRCIEGLRWREKERRVQDYKISTENSKAIVTFFSALSLTQKTEEDPGILSNIDAPCQALTYVIGSPLGLRSARQLHIISYCLAIMK
jgi:hypothetical protein